MAILTNKGQIFLVLSLVHIWYIGSCDAAEMKTSNGLAENVDFYTFSVMDISGSPVSLEAYRGKVSLVVNVASQCGYTNSHYRALILLQEYFSTTEKFNVLAFPCNQFGHQEPGTDKDILDFVNYKMGANFPLFAKVNVNEPDQSPAWRYLIKYSGQTPTWNFWKYLLDHHGRVLNAWGPSTSPDQLHPDIRDAISKIEKDNGSHDNRGQTPEKEL